jgi:hypothetical protein
MCFYNDDGDWSASLIEDSTGPATEACKCYECGAKIAIGDPVRRVYMQEHEECQICEDEGSENFIDRAEMTEMLGTEDDEEGREQLKSLDEHKHDYGESENYHCCDSCNKVRLAVVEREKAEGCPEYSQQPYLGGLWDSLEEHDDGPEYAKHAIAMFPELSGNERLTRLLGAST